jgi:transcription elongation factor GreA
MLKDARDKLEKELKAMEKEYRHELPKEIQRALQMGDLRENAEYHSALERQQFVKARIGHLQQQLKNLSMVDIGAIPKDKVALGSTVRVYDAEADKSITYELVIPDQGDLSKGQISITSPIGRALAGHRVGDEVVVKIPAGTRMYEITELTTLHDKESS